MPVIIDADNPRTIRAIEIASHASEWQAWRTPGGALGFRIPSQSQPGRRYLVTSDTCDCPDFRNHPEEACKHILAVRLHVELQRALDQDPTRPRGHLRLVR